MPSTDKVALAAELKFEGKKHALGLSMECCPFWMNNLLISQVRSVATRRANGGAGPAWTATRRASYEPLAQEPAAVKWLQG